MKTKPSLLLFACASLCASLCACSSPKLTKESVAASTIATFDQYSKVTMIAGPSLRYSYPGSVFSNGAFSLRIAKTSSQASDVQLYFSHEGDKWADFHSASTSDGLQLSITPINKEVQRGADLHPYVSQSIGVSAPAREYAIETVGVMIPYVLLESKKDIGLRIRLYGRAINCDIEIPADYIQGFIAKIQ